MVAGTTAAVTIFEARGNGRPGRRSYRSIPSWRRGDCSSRPGAPRRLLLPPFRALGRRRHERLVGQLIERERAQAAQPALAALAAAPEMIVERLHLIEQRTVI